MFKSRASANKQTNSNEYNLLKLFDFNRWALCNFHIDFFITACESRDRTNCRMLSPAPVRSFFFFCAELNSSTLASRRRIISTCHYRPQRDKKKSENVYIRCGMAFTSARPCFIDADHIPHKFWSFNIIRYDLSAPLVVLSATRVTNRQNTIRNANSRYTRYSW